MKKLLLFWVPIILASCSVKQDYNTIALQNLAEAHVADMDVRSLIDEYLLSVGNDTNKICYALVLPKACLIRLTREETYPTEGALNKIRESLVQRYTLGIAYVDSCYSDKLESKDWLIDNSANEVVNPLWESIVP